MINKEKIKIYMRYKGDVDSWARRGSKQEMLMDSKDWYLIEALIQDIKLIKKGLAAPSYSNSVDEKLNSNCDNIETIEKLKALAEDSDAGEGEGFFNRMKKFFKGKK